MPLFEDGARCAFEFPRVMSSQISWLPERAAHDLTVREWRGEPLQKECHH